jgi:hypothetical protein
MVETPAGSADTPPPCPPRPSSDSDLGFVRRPMVRWLDPDQLIDTAVRVLLSGVFSSYADGREGRMFVPKGRGQVTVVCDCHLTPAGWCQPSRQPARVIS